MCTTIKEELVKEYLEEFVSSPNKFTAEDQGDYSLRTRFCLFLVWKMKEIVNEQSNLVTIEKVLSKKAKYKLLSESDKKDVVSQINRSLSGLFANPNLSKALNLINNPFELGKESYTLFNKYNIHSKSSIPNFLAKTVESTKINEDYLTLSILFLAEKDIEIEDGFNLVASGF